MALVDLPLMESSAEVTGLDQAIITPIVRRALSRATVEVGEWRCQALQA